MAERLAERAAVHRVFRKALLVGIVELPEARRALVEHPAPVGADLVHHLRLETEAAERLQFVKAHVGRLDFHHSVVEDDVLQHGVALGSVEVAPGETKHVRVARELGVERAVVLQEVHKRALLGVPEKRHDLGAQFLRAGAPGVRAGTLDRVRHVGECLERLHEQHLLEARHAAGVVQRLRRPVDEHPVAVAVAGASVRVESRNREVHQRNHPVEHLLEEEAVARVLVVLAHRHEPVERVVHDLVDVHHHGVAAALVEERVLAEVLRAEEIVAHQVALARVAAPRPAVALRALDEDLARRDLERARGDVPDAVDERVGATERTGARKRTQLLVHRHPAHRGTVHRNHLHVAPAARHGGAERLARPDVEDLPLVGTV